MSLNIRITRRFIWWINDHQTISIAIKKIYKNGISFSKFRALVKRRARKFENLIKSSSIDLNRFFIQKAGFVFVVNDRSDENNTKLGLWLRCQALSLPYAHPQLKLINGSSELRH